MGGCTGRCLRDQRRPIGGVRSKLPRMDPIEGSELAPVAPAEPRAPLVGRLMFAPVKLASRRIAPRLSTALFDGVWRLVDHSEPPLRTDEPQPSVPRLALALALEGACNAAVRGVLDQVSRREFARITGRWPGRVRKP